MSLSFTVTETVVPSVLIHCPQTLFMLQNYYFTIIMPINGLHLKQYILRYRPIGGKTQA